MGKCDGISSVKHEEWHSMGAQVSPTGRWKLAVGFVKLRPKRCSKLLPSERQWDDPVDSERKYFPNPLVKCSCHEHSPTTLAGSSWFGLNRLDRYFGLEYIEEAKRQKRTPITKCTEATNPNNAQRPEDYDDPGKLHSFRSYFRTYICDTLFWASAR
ncbi:hypothetical protein T265_07420 [Opisthorchis viverrini]|uniref:Uncharacterized protein n=1 Tax=Opisthorchis viverrini TaxID=6198 RepID=A0A075ABJ5_OPIVI|nr:hypothetical protein T265_07420 [Opisthorchis viverrini]KER25024.1 hypothetical protein T265_07420 [Opisthorchis viverrini]